MTKPRRVVFVCWGNICRSPMAERIAIGLASQHPDLADVVFTSAAVSAEEQGRPVDPRAARVLRASGYSADGHRAHRISAAEILAADLVIGMEEMHVEMMRRMAPSATQLALLSEFDPDAEPGAGVPDPWYGGPEGFLETQAMLEAAMPGVFDRIRALRSTLGMETPFTAPSVAG